MIDNTLKYKTGLKRFWASILDTLVFLPLIFLDELITVNQPVSILIWQASISLLGYSYSIIMHYQYGQTLGKMLTGVKVLHVSESKSLTLKQVVLRDSIPMPIDVAGLIYFASLLKQDLSADNLITSYEELTTIVAFVWVFLELSTMVTNQRRRALHDFVAKTVVIRVNTR
jgi:uncharacterized RDD family membrane protein YckC